MDKNLPIIIDADTGIDDSFAIAVASYTKKINTKLILTTSGNIAAIQAAKNTQNILRAIKKDYIPVACGAEKPMGKMTLDISVHGFDGLGGYQFKEEESKIIKSDIADVLHDLVGTSPQKFVYICLGPATSLATYLEKYPEDKKNIERIYFSGGLLEDEKEDGLPYLGFNVAYDPKAMEIVLNSGLPITICPSDMGHNAYLDWKEVVKLKNTNKTGQMFEYIFRSYKDRHVQNGIATHDLCAVMAYSHKSLFKFKQANVKVKYYNGLPSGVLDFDFDNKNKNCLIATTIDKKKFKRLTFKILRRMP